MVLALISCALGNCNATLSGLFINQWDASSAKINWIFTQSRPIKAPLWILWVLLHSNHPYIFVSYILSGTPIMESHLIQMGAVTGKTAKLQTFPNMNAVRTCAKCYTANDAPDHHSSLYTIILTAHYTEPAVDSPVLLDPIH